MDFSNLKRRCRDEFCIPVIEDYGYRELIWFPQIVEAEIEEFWGSQESFEWAPDNCLPGEWITIKKSSDYEEFYDLHVFLWVRPGSYAINFDGNLPGGLLTPDGKAIFHKGMEGDKWDRESLQESALERSKRLERK